MARKKKFDVRKEVRNLARQRVGQVRPSKPIQPKQFREKAKHKKPITEEDV
jgi:hypothetical protein